LCIKAFLLFLRLEKHRLQQHLQQLARNSTPAIGINLIAGALMFCWLSALAGFLYDPLHSVGAVTLHLFRDMAVGVESKSGGIVAEVALEEPIYEEPVDIDKKWHTQSFDSGAKIGPEEIIVNESWFRENYPKVYFEYFPERTTTLKSNKSDSLMISSTARTASSNVSSLDNTSLYPAPRQQGDQGSCVAWATAYAYKSHQENLEHNWGLSGNNHLFSPAYVYNQH
jgi:hypothetical protein